MQGKISAFVVDFDGHLTNVWEESRELVAAFKQATIERLAVARDGLLQRWEALEHRIREHPEQFGWDYNGRRVAPIADAYILTTTIAGQLLKDAVPDNGERSQLLNKWYHSHYSANITAFQLGAVQLMQYLVETGIPVYVVTNSGTEKVMDKLARMAEEGLPKEHITAIKVMGNARKYTIDDSWTEMAESTLIPGLDRPVLLRRKHYHDALAAIAQSTKSGLENFLVMGDIYELDLALPLHLGSRAVLVANDLTPSYERQFLQEHPRAHVVENLAEELSIVEGAI